MRRVSFTGVEADLTGSVSKLSLMKKEMIGQTILNNWSKLLDYVQATMAHEQKEHFRLLFLNKKNELIADEVQQTGTVDHTPAYPREIVKRALELSATAIILVSFLPVLTFDSVEGKLFLIICQGKLSNQQRGGWTRFLGGRKI